MLAIADPEYLQKVRDFAASINMQEDLEQNLTYLDTYSEHGDRGKTKCILSKDFAPQSFSLLMQRRQDDGAYRDWWLGGLIFHGPHDGHGSGSAPTFSVTLNPTYGWSVHT